MVCIFYTSPEWFDAPLYEQGCIICKSLCPNFFFCLQLDSPNVPTFCYFNHKYFHSNNKLTNNFKQLMISSPKLKMFRESKVYLWSIESNAFLKSLRRRRPSSFVLLQGIIVDSGFSRHVPMLSFGTYAFCCLPIMYLSVFYSVTDCTAFTFKDNR